MDDDLKADGSAIAEFLSNWGGPWNLAAIDPLKKRKMMVRFFTEATSAAAWAVEQNTYGMNLYFHINPTIGPMSKKASKNDIARLEWLHVDIDPRAQMEIEDERIRIRKLLTTELPAGTPPPTFVVDSGNGYWGFWRLTDPLALYGDTTKIEKAEGYNAALGQLFTGDSCQSVDHLARLPGTINLPDKKKAEQGRTRQLAMVVGYNSALKYPLEAFPQIPVGTSSALDVPSTPSRIAPLNSIEQLAEWQVPTEVRLWIVEGRDPENPTRWPSRSEAVYAVCCSLVRSGVPNDTIQSILTDARFAISESVLEKGAAKERYAQRQIERARGVVLSEPLVLNPQVPYASAEQFHIRRMPTLIRFKSDWFDYDGAAYVLLPDEDVRKYVYEFLNIARRLVKELTAPFDPTRQKVTDVIDALESLVRISDRDFEPPCWLTNSSLPAKEIVAFRNGLLHLPTGELLPATDKFFTYNAVAIDFDGGAPEPEQWLKFLCSIWPDDPATIDLLQEVFGYLLLPDTSQQKMFVIKGPTRSGKGTIAKILEKLVGKQNVTSPTLASLAGDFGLEPLIGKQLAIVSDMKLGSKTNIASITENLLRITGEDTIAINRKYKPVTDWRLVVRFVILTNALPRLNDSSSAIANRFVPLIMTKSFLGKEDHGLESRLVAEIPGIMNWAIDGWRRLTSRGRFELPNGSQEALHDLIVYGAPIRSFVEERCELNPNYLVSKHELFAEWKRWCDARNEFAGTQITFGQNLLDAYGDLITTTRPTTEEGRTHSYRGIRVVSEEPPF